VEGRHRASNPEGFGGLVPGGPGVAIGEQPVQVASQGLVESGDPGDAVLELGGGANGCILKQKSVDTTDSLF
jgi:hypothetical protein